jgi:hypothetical protein
VRRKTDIRAGTNTAFFNLCFLNWGSSAAIDQQQRSSSGVLSSMIHDWSSGSDQSRKCDHEAAPAPIQLPAPQAAALAVNRGAVGRR